MTFLEPETRVRNFLRGQLTDYNSSNRSGKQWIFDDWPLDELTPASFPRIAVTKVTETGERIGIGDDLTYDTVTLQIDVIVHRDTADVTITHTDESLGVISNSPRLTLNYLPSGLTDISHTVTSFGTFTSVVNESNFGTPGVDEVEYCISTGSLNFNSADLTSYSGETITASYTEFLRGDGLAQRLARDVVIALRNQWRSDSLLEPLLEPRKIAGPDLVPYDRDRGWFRYTLQYSFKTYNAGEEV